METFKRGYPAVQKNNKEVLECINWDNSHYKSWNHSHRKFLGLTWKFKLLIGSYEATLKYNLYIF